MAEFTTRILVKGATGYMGGSVPAETLQSQPVANGSVKVSALVRRADQAEILREHGVTPILFRGPDDLVALEEIAADYDIVIMPPTICGVGSGLFNNLSIQIPTLMRTAIDKGRAEVAGAGGARWSQVHIADLAPLYGILLRGVLGGEGEQRGKGGGLAYGARGIYFAETGEHTWLELAEGIARAGVELGVLQEPVPVRITLQQSADRWGEGSLEYGELGWCSSSRTRAVMSRDIGWKPTKGGSDLEESFLQVSKLILERSYKV